MAKTSRVIAAESAADAQMYLVTVREIAAGNSPDATLPMALLALSQVLVMGARLGAVEDVVPAERFEPDAGPDAEFDPLRAGLANVFEGLADDGLPVGSSATVAMLRAFGFEVDVVDTGCCGMAGTLN